MENKLYVYTNDVDCFVATDLNDLEKVFREHYGETMSNIGEDICDWYIIDDNVNITIHVDETDYKPNNTNLPITARRDPRGGVVYFEDTANAWANANGRGFLCSTEY